VVVVVCAPLAMFVPFSPAPVGSTTVWTVANGPVVTFHMPTARCVTQGGEALEHVPGVSVVLTRNDQSPLGKVRPPAASTIQPLPSAAGAATAGVVHDVDDTVAHWPAAG